MDTVFPKVFKGDIVIKYRPVYESWYKYLVQRLICFFSTEWWEGKKHSVTNHAELVLSQTSDANFTVIDEEPPKEHWRVRNFNRRIIFRLNKKPENFNTQFDQYVKDTYGDKYAFLTIFLFILNWIFHTKIFTRIFYIPHTYVCSGSTCYFYEVYVGVKCSDVKWSSSDPDDIYKYCKEYPELFELVWDGWSYPD